MIRGEIYYCNLSPVMGSEQGGNRPVLIVQNDVGNQYSPTVIIAVITSKQTKAKLPTHVAVFDGVLKEKSTILLEQLRTVDKKRLTTYAGKLEDRNMWMVDAALRVSLNV